MVRIEKNDYNPPTLKYPKTEYAQSPNMALPRQYAVCAFVAPRGVGKTYSCVELIKSFELAPPEKDGIKHRLRTYVISPSFDANPVFKSLKSLSDEDVYTSYSESILEEIKDKIQADKEKYEEYERKMKAFHKLKKVKRVEELSSDELFLLDELDFEEPEKVEPVSSWLVVDDMVGSAIYKGGRNAFTTMLLKNRHMRLNIALLVQHLKAIPKSIRGNVSMYFIGKFGSKSILPDIYEECASALLTEEQFNEFYETATSRDHGSLIIDFSQPREKRFSINFKEYLLP